MTPSVPAAAGAAALESAALESAALELRGVHTHIGAYHILQGVDFSVREGEVTLLLGRNGAGKTTCLRTLMGLWRASAGSIRFAGREIAALATPDIARLGIAYVPESMGIFSDLTVEENLVLASQSSPSRARFDAARLDRIFQAFPALKKLWQHPAGLLSGGQKQMLSVARAMIEPRRLLLIDEPTKGLAPAIIDNLREALEQFRAEKTTILLVEQNFEFARRLGNQVAVMDNGRIVHRGSMAELSADESLQHRLLGLSLSGAHA